MKTSCGSGLPGSYDTDCSCAEAKIIWQSTRRRSCFIGQPSNFPPGQVVDAAYTDMALGLLALNVHLPPILRPP